MDSNWVVEGVGSCMWPSNNLGAVWHHKVSWSSVHIVQVLEMEVRVDDSSGLQVLLESLTEHAWLVQDVVHGRLVLPDWRCYRSCGGR